MAPARKQRHGHTLAWAIFGASVVAVVAIVGENGAGKTTLVKLLCRLSGGRRAGADDLVAALIVTSARFGASTGLRRTTWSPPPTVVERARR